MAFPFLIYFVSVFLLSLSFFQMPSPVSATKFVAAGTLLCSTLDKPAGQTEPVPVPWAKVQMWEDDTDVGEQKTFSLPGDANDLLAEQQTTDGSFRLDGEQSEFGEEEPFLYIEHKCQSPSPPNNQPLPEDCVYASRINLLQVYKDIGQDISHGDVWTVMDLKIVLGDDKFTAGGKEHKVDTDKRCSKKHEAK